MGDLPYGKPRGGTNYDRLVELEKITMGSFPHVPETSRGVAIPGLNPKDGFVVGVVVYNTGGAFKKHNGA